MNLIGELVDVEDIRLDIDVDDENGLLAVIASMLARRQRLLPAQVLASLVAREQLGSTAMGHGVAIPHARMPECAAPAVSLVRTRRGIPFDAPDRKPVSLFLGMIVPKQANEQHLKMLATAAEMLGSRNFRNQLKTSGDAETVRSVLAAWPGSSA